MTYSPHITHILGMAKSSLDLRGAKASKLELDFMKLLVATNRIQTAGGKALGYLLVFTSEIESTVTGWCIKYQTGSDICVLRAKIDPDAENRLRAEKVKNAKALLSKATLDEETIAAAEAELSMAKEGKELGEAELHDQIQARHPGIHCLSDTGKAEMPLKTAWDFYGIIGIGTLLLS